MIFMRLYSLRKAVILDSLVFSAAHLNPFEINLHMVVDLISIFFMGLLFAYVVLKSGSLLPAIVFHYFHDIFINLVQNTPGADLFSSEALLYLLLWISLVIGVLFTKFVVDHWPAMESNTFESAM